MAKKAISKPAKKVAKPAAKKVAAKPAPKKAATKPVAKKITKPAAKAPAKKVVPKPAPKKAVAKAPAKKVVAKPAPKKVVAKAPIKKVASKPAVKPAAKAVAKPAPAPKPAPVAKPAPAPAPVSKPVVKPTVQPVTATRYSDKDLKEFEALIKEKLVQARSDYDELKESLSRDGDNSTDDTSPTFKMMEDGSDTSSREEVAQLASRQEKFIKSLENALLRIMNKTYGVCRVTGKLIPKERLRLVPHATLSIEAKNMQ